MTLILGASPQAVHVLAQRGWPLQVGIQCEDIDGLKVTLWLSGDLLYPVEATTTEVWWDLSAAQVDLALAGDRSVRLDVDGRPVGRGSLVEV